MSKAKQCCDTDTGKVEIVRVSDSKYGFCLVCGREWQWMFRAAWGFYGWQPAAIYRIQEMP